jgi:hypothetical protein
VEEEAKGKAQAVEDGRGVLDEEAAEAEDEEEEEDERELLVDDAHCILPSAASLTGLTLSVCSSLLRSVGKGTVCRARGGGGGERTRRCFSSFTKRGRGREEDRKEREIQRMSVESIV